MAGCDVDDSRQHSGLCRDRRACGRQGSHLLFAQDPNRFSRVEPRVRTHARRRRTCRGWWMHCDANHRRSSSLCRPFAVRHGSNCVVNAGITPVTSSASTASAPLMEPLALAAELARYDIVFTTYTALTVQERLAASCCAVWGALYPPYQQSYAGVSCSFRTDSVAPNRPRRVPGGAAVAPHVKIAFLPCQAVDRNQSAKRGPWRVAASALGFRASAL